MDEKTFLNFYQNTLLGYSNGLQSYICRLLETEKRITFQQQMCIYDRAETVFFETKKDYRRILSVTSTDINFVNFYEEWEFKKLYKYSVPLFFEITEGKKIKDILKENDIWEFSTETYKPEFIINTSLKESKPLYWCKEDGIFIKFVLQKAYMRPGEYEQIDYRYPIIIYINEENNLIEIRYDSARYNNLLDNIDYENMVNQCISWIHDVLGLELYCCEHADIIEIINDKQDENVKMYKQMMELSSGGSAELTASECADYVLPFIGEIRELIDENEEVFNQSEEAKQLLLQYLSDKEATASYPYIYIKWVKPVESQSYLVKITFDYLEHKYTLMQHITGGCKDFEMERMNDAIKYLCKSGSFVKGERI